MLAHEVPQEPTRAPEATEREVFEARLESLHAVRDTLMEELLVLEQIRKRGKDIRPEDFETLDFILREGYLTGRGKEDALAVMNTANDLRDAALSEIALLEEVNAGIAAAEAGAGFSDLETRQRATVRKQYLDAIKADWGVR
jgi:uncharacterized protein YnzC (UPF0291/DUF896 family)